MLPRFLILALLQLHGDLLDVGSAMDHAEAARAAAEALGRPEVTPELLLGMAYVESGYRPVRATYVARDGSRRAGWRSRRRPPGSRPTYYCGPLQVRGETWGRCLRRMDDLSGSYAAAAEELASWLDDPRCRRRSVDQRTRCALLGYGGGYPLIRRWRYPYPTRVLGRARRIRDRSERLREDAPPPVVSRGES